MKQFKNFPKIEYWFDTESESFFITNIFIHVTFLEFVKNNPTAMSNYVLRGDERADVVAYKLYGDSSLHWVLYLANDIVDPRDWAISSNDFERFLNQKYENSDLEAYKIRNGEVASLQTNSFMINKNPFKTIDSAPDHSFLDPQTYSSVSYREDETMRNDAKRIIKALKKEHMTAFLREFERKVKSLEGR